MTYQVGDRVGYDLHDTLSSICRWLKPESYLEIGVDGGGSLAVVINSAPMLREVVLCDTWNPEYCEHGFTSHFHIQRMLAEMNFHGKVEFLNGDSAELIPKVSREFDLILVDGGHDLYHALGDFACATELISLDGVIVVDDVIHHSYPEVARAMRMILPCAHLAGLDILRERSGKRSNCMALKRTR